MNVAPNPPAPGDNRPVQLRRRYSNYSFILNDTGNANSSYHGLQATFRKAFRGGLSALSTYSWAKAIDNDSYDGKATRNYRPQDLDRGRSSFDVRHRFTTSLLYELPLARHSAGLVKWLGAGWQINGILALQAGLPFHVTTTVDRSNTGVTFGSRPNRACNGNLPSEQRVPERWFDTSCFVLPAANTYGNAGVHYLETDGIRNVDLALFKHFVFKERWRLQLRGEAFNALNLVNFGRPNSGLESPIFGRPTTALDARIIQVAAKVIW